MGKSDQWVVITIVVLILLHISILVIGYVTSKVAYLAAIINLAAGASLIGYWVIRQMQIQQHIIETREVIVLLGEVLVIGAAVFYIFSGQKGNWLKVTQYTFFGIHLFVLILALIFMLTFKMDRLF